jgi:hypothetical protein
MNKNLLSKLYNPKEESAADKFLREYNERLARMEKTSEMQQEELDALEEQKSALQPSTLFDEPKKDLSFMAPNGNAYRNRGAGWSESTPEYFPNYNPPTKEAYDGEKFNAMNFEEPMPFTFIDKGEMTMSNSDTWVDTKFLEGAEYNIKQGEFNTPMLSKALAQSEPSNEVIKEKPKFGRAKFAKKPLAEGEVPKDKRKIKANKKNQDGIDFDSTLELYMYNILKENNIRFEMKISYVLQEAFTYQHENIRQMVVTPDFILTDYPIIIDTKGFANEQSPMRYKMLKHKLHLEGNEKRILMPSSQKKCRHVVECIKKGYFTVEEPLTENAGTARKNKMKKLGWIYSDGDWLFYGEDAYPTAHYNSTHIMNLEKYDFEELLLKHK